MPKKKSPAKTKRKDFSLKVTFLIFGAFLLFAIFCGVQQAKSLPFCANSVSCITDLSGKKAASNEGTFMGKAVTAPNPPDKATYALKEMNNVLGDTTADQKHIYVDLSKQRLYAYEGNNKVYDFPVSTGKWGPTPTGDFRIWIWLRYTRMAGGSAALGTYYNLPNVPYTMYFWNAATPKSSGYSLHGAYWHNNFGHPMSHGCVNMKIEDAGKIYYWTNPQAGTISYASDKTPGTLITIYGVAPKE